MFPKTNSETYQASYKLVFKTQSLRNYFNCCWHWNSLQVGNIVSIVTRSEIIREKLHHVNLTALFVGIILAT